MCSPPAQPVAWFSIFCAKPSAQKFCAGQKRVSRQDKQAETDLTIQFAQRRWLRHQPPSANPLEHGWAPADFAWNLVPRLIDTRRIRKSKFPKVSSIRKATKSASKSRQIHKSASARSILTKRTLVERARRALQALQTTWSCVFCQLSEALLCNTTFFVPSRSVRCYAGGATKGSGPWRHPRSLFMILFLHLTLPASCTLLQKCSHPSNSP